MIIKAQAVCGAPSESGGVGQIESTTRTLDRGDGHGDGEPRSTWRGWLVGWPAGRREEGWEAISRLRGQLTSSLPWNTQRGVSHIDWPDISVHCPLVLAREAPLLMNVASTFYEKLRPAPTPRPPTKTPLLRHPFRFTTVADLETNLKVQR